MRKSKLLLIFLCLVLLCTSLAPQTYAFERKDHDKYMVDVLFKNFKDVKNDPEIADEIDALECACYLAIDQFNGNGQGDMTTLANYGVKNLPSLSEIDFSASGTTHRTHTHCGWDHQYSSITRDKMPLRKQLMIDTADAIFDFDGNEKQKESFCAVLYYVHILGDFMDDESYIIRNGQKMDAGGRRDKEDIIHELQKHFKVLFADQQNTNKYRYLNNALERYNSKLSKIMTSEGGINTDEEFALRQEYVKGIMDVLTMYLPEMLKVEQFFYDVFYK